MTILSLTAPLRSGASCTSRTRVALAAVLAYAEFTAAQPPLALDYHRLAVGFVAEKKNEVGFATGYSSANRWGEYTAYLMTRNASGQRTWRIEQYQELPGAGFWQGSSMYLLEGARLALLIDTAQPSQAVRGVNDLKTLVRHLLGHDDDGRIRAKPVDFIVANTHDHPDHIGENRQMNDRPVYYMDGDWPTNAPGNYLPVREGGGTTKNGRGTAVGDIELGNRPIKAVAIPPHTPGSTAYLDVTNKLLFSGDALGSGWPWLHWASISEYAVAVDRVSAMTAAIPGLAVLPGHFYQVEAYGRRDGPLGNRYIADQQTSAHGIVSGAIEGEPYFLLDPTVYWGGTGSARLTYTLARIDAAEGSPAANYRAVRIPGASWRREWVRDPRQQKLFDIRSEFHLIRSSSGNVLFLLQGSDTALLIGTGAGEAGLAELVKRLIGGRNLLVTALTNEPSQTGGLKLLTSATRVLLEDGLVIDIGTDKSGKPLQVEAHAARNSFSLLSVADRIVFAAAPALMTSSPASWRTATQGRYDLVYTATSDKWFTSPADLEHSMHHCVCDGLYGGAIWTAGIAPDLEYRNNLVSSRPSPFGSFGPRRRR